MSRAVPKAHYGRQPQHSRFRAAPPAWPARMNRPMPLQSEFRVSLCSQGPGHGEPRKDRRHCFPGAATVFVSVSAICRRYLDPPPAPHVFNNSSHRSLVTTGYTRQEPTVRQSIERRSEFAIDGAQTAAALYGIREPNTHVAIGEEKPLAVFFRYPSARLVVRFGCKKCPIGAEHRNFRLRDFEARENSLAGGAGGPEIQRSLNL